MEKKMFELRESISKTKINNWHQDTFLQWQWWFLLTLLVVSWLIWWKLVDKKRIEEILLYGFLIAIITLTIDSIGLFLNLWEYPYELIPVIPFIIPIDLAVVPCITMLFYQNFKSWKLFIVIIVIFALVSSFIAEPVFILMGFYKLHNWKLFYSFLVFVFNSVITKWVVDRIKNVGIQFKNRN